MPLDLVFEVEAYGSLKFNMRLAWLFGLIDKEIAGRRKPEEEKRLAGSKQKRHRRRIGLRTLFQILQIKGLLRQGKDLLKDMFGCLRLKDFRADFTVGLDDPAETGFLFAVIAPIIPFLGSSRFSEIRVRPSFEDGATCKGYLRGMVRLLPIRLVLPLLKFVFSLPTLRAVKTVVLARWK